MQSKNSFEFSASNDHAVRRTAVIKASSDNSRDGNFLEPALVISLLLHESGTCRNVELPDDIPEKWPMSILSDNLTDELVTKTYKCINLYKVEL